MVVHPQDGTTQGVGTAGAAAWEPQLPTIRSDTGCGAHIKFVAFVSLAL